MVVNMNMRGDKEGNINQYLSDTIAHVFPNIYVADVKGSTNRELFASCNANMLNDFTDNVNLESHANLRALMQELQTGLTAYEAGTYRMTDDSVPVELLSMQVMDELL